MKDRICFAQTEDGCLALEEYACQGCRFYKTAKQLEKEQQASMDRLEKLDLLPAMLRKYGGTR